MTEAEVCFKVFEMLVGEYTAPLNFEDFVIIAKQASAVTGIVLYGNESAAAGLLASTKETAE